MEERPILTMNLHPETVPGFEQDEPPKSIIGDVEFTDEQLKQFVRERVHPSSTFSGDEPQAKQEDQLVKFALPGFLAELDERVYELEQKPLPPHSGYGVAIAMLLWAACIFAFAIFAPFPVWVRGCADVVGFVALLIGILGTCIEVFKGKS